MAKPFVPKASAGRRGHGSVGAGSPADMDGRNGIGRRAFFAGGAGLFFSPAARPRDNPADEYVRRFGTGAYEVQMTVEFHDHHERRVLGFDERMTDRHFCLSADGIEGHDCVKNFVGAIAVARYHIRSSRHGSRAQVLRERVRAIDQDEALGARPPFDRAIELQNGVASDIQTFGYIAGASSAADDASPWCLLRQDLFLDGDTAPFLVIHWKHTLSAIRILDIVTGRGTREEKSGQ